MRRVRYSVVMSLDGYIAGPKGEADWITTDPEFDFTALFSQFDTILVGRRTFEASWVGEFRCCRVSRNGSNYRSQVTRSAKRA